MPLTHYATDEDAHADAMARGADCKRCPLFGQHRGPIPSDIPRKARLVVIGEAPGKFEVKRGVPFVGASGEELAAGLADGGLRRADVAVLNVIECQPPDELQRYVRSLKRQGQASPLECCRPRLEHDLRAATKDGAAVILSLGAAALDGVARLYGVPIGKRSSKAKGHSVKVKRLASIVDQRGHPFQLNAVRDLPAATLFPSLHPAYALRKAHHLLHVIRDDIANAAKIAVAGGWKGYSLPPDWTVAKSVTAVKSWINQAWASGQRITVDIETDGLSSDSRIRCIGMGYFRPGSERPTIMVVPLRRKSGAVIWPLPLAREVKDLICAFLDAVPLAFHNGGFDTKVLLRRGYMTKRRKTWFDTEIGHHVTIECDAPHDLAFVSSRFMVTPLWKMDVDHKAVDSEDRDVDLWRYNAIDVDAQATSYRGLTPWIREAKNTRAFEVDSRKAPIARDMGELGLYIDEPRRQQMSLDLNRWLEERTAKLREIAKWPELNPKSNRQIADWLFNRMGWTPPMNTDAEVWEEGDDPATSIPALIELEDSGQLTKRGLEFVETLIQHRELEQLRKLYVDGMVKHLRPTKWDGILHLPVTYLVHVVPTGRWSSSPNVQNWPTSGRLNMRELCIAPPGHVIVGADYEQIEARLYAVLANDQKMLEAFRQGWDVHSYNAAVLFVEPGATEERIFEVYEEILKLKKSADPIEKARAKRRRDTAKTYCYLKQYGGEPEKLAETMRKKREKGTGVRMFPGLRDDDVARWDANWNTYHPETVAWHESIARYVQQHGCVADAVIGRVRHFPDGPTQKNAPPNTTVQGSAAAIADLALIALDTEIGHRAQSAHSGLFGQVHDWIGAYVPESHGEWARDLFARIMPYDFRDMPIPCVPLITRDVAAQSG